MRDVRHAVILEHQSRAQLALRPGDLVRTDALVPDALDFGERRGLHGVERHAFHGGERQRVEKRLSGRHDPTGHGRREAAFDERGVEPRLPLRRRHAGARPEIQPLRARQDAVEHEQRKEVLAGCGRRVKRQLDVAGHAFAFDRDAALPGLRRFDDADPRGLDARRNRREIVLGASQHLVRVDVPDDDERGVVRNVEPPVMGVEVVARDRAQVVEPSDGRMPIRMRAEGRRGDLDVEQLFRVVFAALEVRI